MPGTRFQRRTRRPGSQQPLEFPCACVLGDRDLATWGSFLGICLPSVSSGGWAGTSQVPSAPLPGLSPRCCLHFSRILVAEGSLHDALKLLRLDLSLTANCTQVFVCTQEAYLEGPLHPKLCDSLAPVSFLLSLRPHSSEPPGVQPAPSLLCEELWDGVAPELGLCDHSTRGHRGLGQLLPRALPGHGSASPRWRASRPYSGLTPICDSLYQHFQFSDS